MPVGYHRNVSTASPGDRLGAHRTRGALGVQAAWGPAETTLSKVSESESHRLYYGYANLLTRSRVEAICIQAVARAIEVSKSFASRRFRLSHGRVRSTTHWRGRS